MARYDQCEQCGAVNLAWRGNPHGTNLCLYETDGRLHSCKPENLVRKNEEMKAQMSEVREILGLNATDKELPG